ncbi:MAG: 50S ribosomal protein L37e [Euryarchaeota archaeon]|nr:50S ribosomal protein L37e [Euryarchaeota archaeon]
MSKGTPSFGKRNKTTHIVCRRCGHRSYNVAKRRCAHCGYPDPKWRSYSWARKRKQRGK